MGVAMSHHVVTEEDKVTEDMSVNNVEQYVTEDDDSDQHCDGVSLLML